MFVELVVFFMLNGELGKPFAGATTPKQFQTQEECEADLANFLPEVRKQMHEMHPDTQLRDKAGCLSPELAMAILQKIQHPSMQKDEDL